eukprot:m.82492 g.82492  ORF g.82492 m.82492 type:complete len:209 (+) comp21051_c0_seq1:3-629(+)
MGSCSSVPTEQTEMLKTIVISGPSGVGKSTLLNMLRAEYKNIFALSVSHTTREPRVGEKDGRDYHFTTKEKMLAEIAKGNFIESAEFSGNLYGTSRQSVQDVLDQKKICLLDIEKQGCESFRKTNFRAKYVFIAPTSIEELERRLRARDTETEETLKARLATALEAIEYGNTPGKFDVLVVNDDQETAYAELREALQPEIEEAKKLQA